MQIGSHRSMTRASHSLQCAGLLILILVQPTAADPAALLFVGLGDLPGGANYSVANDISADGTAVVGSSSAGPSDTTGFIWTQATGMVPLVGSRVAAAVSPNGSVVVGQGIDSGCFRWNDTEGLVPLGMLFAGDLLCQPLDVADNGEDWAGVGIGSFWGVNAFLRPGIAAGMTPIDTSAPVQGARSFANAISADGSTVVGDRETLAGEEAYVSSGVGSIVDLGDLPGGIVASSAGGVSSDGSVVVGWGTSASGVEAFRWTQSAGMIGLGDRPGGVFESRATAVSADGTTVVGMATTDSGASAFIWDANNGMREVKDILLSQIPVGWILTSATSLSADGSVVVGVGTNPSGDGEAWMAVVSEANAVPSLGPTGIAIFLGMLGIAGLSKMKMRA